MRLGEPCLMILGGQALRAAPLRTAHRIAAATGTRLLAQQSNARIERGAGRPSIDRVPYPTDVAVSALSGIKHLVLVGAREPVGFFAYPGKPSRLYPDDCTVHVLARAEHDLPDALLRLAELLGAPAADAAPAAPRGDPSRGVPSRARRWASPCWPCCPRTPSSRMRASAMAAGCIPAPTTRRRTTGCRSRAAPSETGCRWRPVRPSPPQAAVS